VACAEQEPYPEALEVFLAAQSLDPDYVPALIDISQAYGASEPASTGDNLSGTCSASRCGVFGRTVPDGRCLSPVHRLEEASVTCGGSVDRITETCMPSAI
jgi:hypothetical protein